MSALPIAPPRAAGPDRAAAERAVADLLVALGADLADPHLAGTPRRVATALAEAVTPEPFSPTTFANTERYDELVLVADIPVRSLCRHHLLPFVGVAHVGYLPGDRLVGLSKLARAVDHAARRLQTQERLTHDVADWLVTTLRPKGAGIVVEAEHTCMTWRGVRAGGTLTVTSALRGVVRDDQRTRQEFLALCRRPDNR